MIKLLRQDYRSNNENAIFKTAIKNNSVFVVLHLLTFISSYEHAKEIHLLDMCKYSLQIQTRNEQITLVLVDKVFSLYPFEELPLNELLIYSLQKSFVNVVRKLLFKGADPNHKDESGHSVLYYTLNIENCDLLQLVIDHYHIDINETFNDENIIFYAINLNNSKISSILISEGTDIYCKNKQDEYLIQVYIKKGWFLHVKHVFSKGFNKCYDDDKLFIRMCTDALNAKSSIMFHIIVQNYFATKITRWWRRMIKKRMSDT
jgi:hypothetical protein